MGKFLKSLIAVGVFWCIFWRRKLPLLIAPFCRRQGIPVCPIIETVVFLGRLQNTPLRGTGTIGIARRGWSWHGPSVSAHGLHGERM